jgi:hypothetical protein
MRKLSKEEFKTLGLFDSLRQLKSKRPEVYYTIQIEFIEDEPLRNRIKEMFQTLFETPDESIVKQFEDNADLITRNYRFLLDNYLLERNSDNPGSSSYNNIRISNDGSEKIENVNESEQHWDKIFEKYFEFQKETNDLNVQAWLTKNYQAPEENW